MSAWAASLAVVWLVGGGLAEAPELREEKAAGLVFVVPMDAEVTSHPGEADDVGVVAVTRREEVLIITVYRGRDRPRERKALKRHVTAFEREISSQGDFTTRKFRAHLLEGKRPGREFLYTWLRRPYKAQIVAARIKKATVVSAWTRPTDRRTDFATKVLDSLRVE